MKPTRLRILPLMVPCLLTALFLSGCVSLPGPEEGQLHQSIIRGDSETAVKLINSGVLDGRIESQSFGVTALYLAAKHNRSNVVEALLAKGANPNTHSINDEGAIGGMPLQAAAFHRHAESLKLLLAHGADVHAQVRGYEYKWTPLELSVLVTDPPGPVTDMLIEAGAKPTPASLDKPGRYGGFQFRAATRWAYASYLERRGKTEAAAQEYEDAARWYELASKKVLGQEKWVKFMTSPLMRGAIVVGGIAAGTAAQSQGTTIIWGDVNPLTTPLDPEIGKVRKSAASAFKIVGERYAAYSKLCADRAKELRQTQSRP